MSKNPYTCTFVMHDDGPDGESNIVVVGVGRSSRRQVRVRAKQIARSLNIQQPIIGTFHTRKPVTVAPDIYVELLP